MASLHNEAGTGLPSSCSSTKSGHVRRSWSKAKVLSR